MDGVAVQAVAGSCTWDHTFFDSMTDRDLREMRESFERNERTYEFEGESGDTVWAIGKSERQPE